MNNLSITPPQAKVRTSRIKPRVSLPILDAWAVVDTRLFHDPFPIHRLRWTYHGERGKKKGIIAIYDKKPVIPLKWKKRKIVVPVVVEPCSVPHYYDSSIS